MRIYLDNAATSWPKPESVYAACDDWQRRVGAASGRGVTREANETDRTIGLARKRIAQLINAENASRVAFTFNGTDALNLALHGLLKPGDHTVSTVCEHNSVLRPLAWMKEQREVSSTLVPCNGQGFVDPDDVREAITPQTKLIALVHVSNVTGAIQPAEEIGRIAAEYGLLYLVDGAQSLGHIPVDVQRIGCQFLAAPGHKGLLGPLGTGLLYVAPGMEHRLVPTRQGGTGTLSEDDRQPTSTPDRYESGNLNVPGIAGLGAGVGELLKVDPAERAKEEQRLTRELLEGLSELPGLRVYGPSAVGQRTGVVSFNLPLWDPQELAGLLDAQWSIQTRAGLHCAPRMHAALGTLPSGTVRVSLGPFNTAEHVSSLSAALRELATV
jgi:cysteine desulfurase/selenocysteine lyase